MPSKILGTSLTALIDRMNGAIGRAVGWLSLALVIMGALNAVGRYAGRYVGVNLSSNFFLELQWYLFSLIFLLGAAAALRDDAHVRVDVVYSRMRARTRSWIDLAGTALLLFPFCVFTLWVSVPSVANSWRLREGSPDPGGLPRYPLKAVILVCFALLILQGVSEFARHLRGVREREASQREGHHVTEGV